MSDAKNIRKLLLSMSDEQLMDFLASMTNKIPKTTKAAKKIIKQDSSVRWFDKELSGLDSEGLQRLEELESERKRSFGKHVEEKRYHYLTMLRDMKLTVPDSFRDMDPKTMFTDLKTFCEENDIPQEIISRVVPEFLNYIDTGHMRPICFVGAPGSGKTKTTTLLVSRALQMPTEVIKLPQVSGSHGMVGDNGSYINADAGLIAKGRLRHNSILVTYLLDEGDKIASRSDGKSSSVADELLSITDESNNSIYDEFLEAKLVGLEHCPMIFTANDLSNMNPILVDRMTVIKFPDPDEKRIKSICKKFTEDKLRSRIYDHISFDYSAMNNAIDQLVDYKVTSLRKHQQMIELVLDKALMVYFNNSDDHEVKVTEEMFKQAITTVSGIEKRRIGF